MSEDPCDCTTALENLYRFIDREIDSATDDQIRSHLDGCSHCVTEFDLERLVRIVVGRSCAEKAPGELRERVLMHIRTIQIDYRSDPLS